MLSKHPLIAGARREKRSGNIPPIPPLEQNVFAILHGLDFPVERWQKTCMEKTRPELLESLKQEDAQESWTDFFAIYRGPIVRFAMKKGLREDEAADVLQEVMIELLRVMQHFEYDARKGSFRNFLFTITKRKIYRHWRRKKNKGDFVTGNAERLDYIEDAAGTGDPRALAEAEEAAWQMSIIEDCLDELCANKRFSAETIQIFTEYVIQGRPVAELAATYGLEANNIYQIRNRIITVLQKRLAKFRSES